MSHYSILVSAVVIGAVGVLSASSATAQTRTFRVDPNGGSRAAFTSDAPLETINGVSSRISGDLTVPVTNLAQTRGTLTVPVESLRTGIELRDEHLRNNTWLNAEAHPNITFEITRIEGATSIQPEQDLNDLRVRGRLTIKGTTREITARARARLIPLNDEMRAANITGDVLRIRVQFSINLSDFGVEIPSVVRLKVANEITITVNLRAVAT